MAHRLTRVIAPSYEMAASGYYRVVLPLYTLNKQARVQAVWRGQIDATDEQLSQDKEAQRALLGLLQWADIYMLERESRESFIAILRKAKELGKRVVMDIDDHVIDFVHINEPTVSSYWQSNLAGLMAVMREVDEMIVTTPRLAREYRQYIADNASITCISNYIDADHPRWKKAYRLRQERQPDDLLTLGWMGGPTHLDDLKILHEPLKAAMKKHPIRFKCVGLQPDWLDDLPQDRVIRDSGYTAIDDYPSRFYDFDIGLIPLSRTPFNDIGKSDLKFLEYGILGIPSIVSRSPAYESAKHKSTAWVTSNDAWPTAIDAMLQVRDSISHNVRQYVIKSRSIEHNAYRWGRVFDAVRRRYHG